MKLLLIVLLAWMLIGLLRPRFERLERWAVIAFAVALTLLYYRFGERFM